MVAILIIDVITWINTHRRCTRYFTDHVKAVDDTDNVEEDDDRLFLGETFLADDIVLKVHQVGHLVGELVGDQAVQDEDEASMEAA